MKLYNSDDTICAIATAPGVGGISVIRVCGTKAESITRNVCEFLPAELESHKVYYGFLSYENIDIDEVLVTYFANGKSFTGNSVFEISCHGGHFVTQKVLNSIIKSGARLAHRGEFSYRAFANGRIDLIQAESILSLIHSQSDRLNSISISQLKGRLSSEISLISDKLTLILANLEANIDFAAEDIEIISANKFVVDIDDIISQISSYISSYDVGKVIKEGFQVSLVGLPNAGKSSFLNRLIGQDKAIVTDIPGTTRDIVEATVMYNGIEFTFFDTAGIHKTNNPIEKIGISKSKNSIKDSDYIFFLFDPSNLLFDKTDYLEILSVIDNKKCIFVNTKSDLCNESKSLILHQDSILKSFGMNTIFDEFLTVSSTTGDGFNGVDEWMASKCNFNFNESSAVLTQSRHFELLCSCHKGLLKAKSLMLNSESPEFIAFELQSSLSNIYEVLGQVYDDQVMDKVFNDFCIGK